jgi:hypothetical protein
VGAALEHEDVPPPPKPLMKYCGRVVYNNGSPVDVGGCQQNANFPVPFYRTLRQSLASSCNNDTVCIDKGKVGLYAIYDVPADADATWDALFKAYGIQTFNLGLKTANQEIASELQQFPGGGPADKARPQDLKYSLELTKNLVSGVWAPLVDARAHVYRAANDQFVHTAIDTLKAKAPAEVAQYSGQIMQMKEVSRLVDEYAKDLDGLSQRFATVADTYVTYRDSEPGDVAALTDVAARASTADLDALAPLRSELADRARGMGLAPDLLREDINNLRHDLVARQVSFDTAIAPYATLLTQRGLPSTIDKTAATLVALEKMDAYVADRDWRIYHAIETILSGMTRRRDTLMILAVDEKTRQTRTQVQNAAIETQFADEANQRVAGLWTKPDQSPKLKLSFYEPYAQRLYDFQSIKPLCDQQQPWMKTGCDSYQRNLSKVTLYLANSLPLALKLDLSKLRAAGVAEATLQQIQAALDAKQLTTAAHLHDQAVRAAEQGQ